MNANISLLLVVAFFLFSCGGATSPQEASREAAAEDVAEDLHQAMPGAVETVFENDYVRAMEVRLEPGEEQPVHEGAPRVIYSLSDYTINWTENGIDEGAKSWEAGDAHWHDAGPHAAENTGATTAEYLVVARTKATLPECDLANLAEDVNQAAPDYSEILLENEHVRVTAVQLPAGASIPEHAGINRVIYALSDYQIDYTSNREGSGAKALRQGEAHWHEACRHSLTNTGETEARFLVIAFKK